ncbi:HI1506-related protein [Pseudoalteromonas rhizosphaerae]|uniref:HI1506-related protein n=1 Tax=Pseudoalteromonas rhizosphaerae TaxID=2518973 RepID=UPI0021496D5D|nr:HI1506-related protein [Pseudoalteromonas rhizosphaerae]
MAKTLKLSLISAVIVSCMQPTGYRRAGLSFNQGKNEIPADGLDQEQLDAIENDPRLSVQAIPLDASTTPQSQLDANNLGADLDNPLLYTNVDYTQAPIELQPVIALMIDAQMELKPVVEQVAYEAPGETEGEIVKVKVSAAERDAAWLWLQEAAKAGEGE